MRVPLRSSLQGHSGPRENTDAGRRTARSGSGQNKNVIATKESRGGSILRIRIEVTALPGREDARQVLRGVVTVQLKLFLKIIEFLIR